MPLENLTPHTIEIRSPQGHRIIAPEGTVARVATETQVVCLFEGIDIIETRFFEPYMEYPGGKRTTLPHRVPGKYYIVSRIVKSARPDREDFLCPGELIRDDQGRVVGCKNLSR